MKRASFFIIFVSFHVAVVGLHIYKHTKRTQLLFEHQRQESFRNDLMAAKQQLVNEAYAHADRKAIKEFAQKQLEMKPIRLSQVKKISRESTHIPTLHSKVAHRSNISECALKPYCVITPCEIQA